MNRQELIDEINKTKEHLANMEKMLEESEHERWEPKESEKYWYINGVSSATDTCFMSSSNDLRRIKTYNCFRTKEKAEAEAEKILVRRQLEDIARRLNKKAQNEFNAYRDYKYYLYICDNNGVIGLGSNLGITTQGVVYCLSENFYKVALKGIGEDRLKKYLRSE